MAKAISVVVTGNAAPLRKELKKATQDLSGFAKAQQGFGDIAKLGYAVAGASVVRFGAQLVKAALDDEKSQALLRASIAKTGFATEEATASAEAYVKQLSLSSNIADDSLRPALATLTRATGDVTRAQTLLTLSTEIATATGKDLASVSIAVAKASLGSTTALGKLGVPLSEGAKQSGNFALAFEELNKQFSGSNAAALNTTAGKVANLSIRFNELKETLGSQLLPVVDKVTSSLIKAADAADKGESLDALKNTFTAISDATPDVGAIITDLTTELIRGEGYLLDYVKALEAGVDMTGQGIKAFPFYVDQVVKTRQALEEATTATYDYSAAANSLIYAQNTTFTKIYADRVEEVARQTEAAKTRAEKAREKFAALGATLKGTLNTALTDARNKLQAAKDEMKAFGDATASAISGNVTIGDALSQSTDGENNYTEALKKRADAYRALNIAKATGDIGAYTRALDEVSDAEAAVTSAQSGRRSPGQLFADQIAKAKKFATDLKTLISPPFNLSEAGLSQLINLGVDSGSSVAGELVAGTSSLSVGAINEGLAGIGTVAGQLGTTAGSIFRGGAVGDAQADVDRLGRASVTTNNNSYSITITSGVGDEVEIGKQVVKYLQAYDKKFSGIPIKVKK